jgi:hypothetical protein
VLGECPQTPRRVLNVGVTGHRAARLSPELLALLPRAIGEMLAALREAARRDADAADDLPGLWLHTALATGADQIAADAARAASYCVRAVLPFVPDIYREDFTQGPERDELERQLAAADAVFALPGSRADGDAAYVMLGHAIVAAADLLVAAWDGDTERVPGGTAHVIDLALRAGVPVIHVRVDRAADSVGPVLLLTGDSIAEAHAGPLADTGGYDALARAVLAR